MDIWIWLLVAVMLLVPKKAAEGDAAFDKLRSVALLLGLLFLIVQV